MKDFFKLSTLFYWLTCIVAFWVTAIMYPFNVYYGEDLMPFLSFTEILAVAGITFLMGTALFLILQIVGILGKPIGLKKNLITFMLYHFIVSTGFGVGADYLLDCIRFSPYWIYLLIGFIPAALCSIIFSYDVTRHRKDKTDA